MSAEYVRGTYGVEFKVGDRLLVDGKPGTLVSFPNQYLGVRFDGETHTRHCHPTWRVYRLPSLTLVSSVINGRRFNWSTEADLQEGLHEALQAAGLKSVREVRLTPRDRIDLLVGTVGVEVKVHRIGRVMQARKVLDQLRRYAASDQVTELVLVTTSIRHKAMPTEVGGVPLTVVVVGGLR